MTQNGSGWHRGCHAVLDGSFGTATFQVGANVGETISVSLTTDVTAASIGTVNTQTGAAFDLTDATVANFVTLEFGDGVTADLYGTVDVAADSSLQEAADAINNANISGIAAFVNAGDQLQVLSDVGDVTFTETVVKLSVRQSPSA